MKRIMMLLAATGFALAAPAFADDAAAGDHDAVKRAADDALASKAGMPEARPSLPTMASDHARYAHENIAFGQHGEAMRAAHEQAGVNHEHGDDDHGQPEHHQGHGAAMGAAGAANADAHDAAEHAREHHMEGPSGTGSPGQGSGTGGMPTHHH